MRSGLESLSSSVSVAVELAAMLTMGLMAVPRLRLVAALAIAMDGGRFGGMVFSYDENQQDVGS